MMVRPRRQPREDARADERQRVRGHLEQYGAALSVTFCRAAGRTEYENQTASNGPPGWLHRQVDTMKIWSIKHKGHEIRVENGWFSGERLIVDGEIQDEHTGFAFRSRLWGKSEMGTEQARLLRFRLVVGLESPAASSWMTG